MDSTFPFSLSHYPALPCSYRFKSTGQSTCAPPPTFSWCNFLVAAIRRGSVISLLFSWRFVTQCLFDYQVLKHFRYFSHETNCRMCCRAPAAAHFTRCSRGKLQLVDGGWGGYLKPLTGAPPMASFIEIFRITNRWNIWSIYKSGHIKKKTKKTAQGSDMPCQEQTKRKPGCPSIQTNSS